MSRDCHAKLTEFGHPFPPPSLGVRAIDFSCRCDLHRPQMRGSSI
jgi:hypothetical protein